VTSKLISLGSKNNGGKMDFVDEVVYKVQI